MTGFSAEWLNLRAPADEAARDAGLIKALVEWVAGRRLRIHDLGGGSGAALRALSPVLPADQNWCVFDDDAALLSQVGGGAETVAADLAAQPETAFTPLPDLVTGFAFFDLTSASWIDRIADLIAASGAALYAPLSYDGVEKWSPEPAFEAKALAAFNRDMQRDKGFGPALGGDAAAYLAIALRSRGYSVQTAVTPWRLTRPRDSEMMDTLAKGGAAALSAALPTQELTQWRDGRLAATRAQIGHLDILALPPVA